jgi:hypothetical protein
MDVNVRIEQKDCVVSISPSAEAALKERRKPLVAEIVVTLACCVRKEVAFRDLQEGEEPLLATDNLGLTLVSAEHKQKTTGNLPPIKNWNALAPQWLSIDYKNGAWQGDFGYSGKK